jgi:hypothetical protein
MRYAGYEKKDHPETKDPFSHFPLPLRISAPIMEKSSTGGSLEGKGSFSDHQLGEVKNMGGTSDKGSFSVRGGPFTNSRRKGS